MSRVPRPQPSKQSADSIGLRVVWGDDEPEPPAEQLPLPLQWCRIAEMTATLPLPSGEREPMREFLFTVNCLGRHRVQIYPSDVTPPRLCPEALEIRFPDGSVAVITAED